MTRIPSKIFGLIVAAMIGLSVSLVACTPTRNGAKDQMWHIIQSPLTGLCYETMEISPGWNASRMGMSTVSCEFLGRDG